MTHATIPGAHVLLILSLAIGQQACDDEERLGPIPGTPDGGMGGTGGDGPSSDINLRVELVWTTPNDPDPDDIGPGTGSDLDLHVGHPLADGGQDLDNDGTNEPWFDSTYDVYWFNAGPDWNALGDTSDDPILERDDTDGAGPEIFGLDVLEQGTYRVGVHYFDDHQFGSSDAIVRVFVDDALEMEFGPVTLEHRDMWDVARIEGSPLSVTAVTADGGGPDVTPNYDRPGAQAL
ncbi:MAG: hypothetical protein WBG86_10600 [Polyangiales bacterium]